MGARAQDSAHLSDRRGLMSAAGTMFLYRNGTLLASPSGAYPKSTDKTTSVYLGHHSPQEGCVIPTIS